MDNEPSQIRRSSASPSLQDPNEQAISPTAVEKSTPEDRPLSPVHSAAGSAHSTEEFGTALIERPNLLENTDTVPAMEYSDGPESSKMASERLPVEFATKSTQAQRTLSTLSALASAIQAGEDLPRQEEPSAAAEPTIPVLTDPVPYYAKPKILVQKPSDSSVFDMSGPRTIDEVLTNEHLASSLQSLPKVGDLTKVPPMPAPDGQLPEAQVPGFQVPGVPVTLVSVPALPRTPQIKKRSKAVQKTRNLAARKTILNVLWARNWLG